MHWDGWNVSAYPIRLSYKLPDWQHYSDYSVDYSIVHNHWIARLVIQEYLESSRILGHALLTVCRQMTKPILFPLASASFHSIFMSALFSEFCLFNFPTFLVAFILFCKSLSYWCFCLFFQNIVSAFSYILSALILKYHYIHVSCFTMLNQYFLYYMNLWVTEKETDTQLCT